jgi:hypothetical protein
MPKVLRTVLPKDEVEKAELDRSETSESSESGSGGSNDPPNRFLRALTRAEPEILTSRLLLVGFRALGVLQVDSSAIDDGGFEGLVTEPVSEAIMVTLLVRGP